MAMHDWSRALEDLAKLKTSMGMVGAATKEAGSSFEAMRRMIKAERLTRAMPEYREDLSGFPRKNVRNDLITIKSVHVRRMCRTRFGSRRLEFGINLVPELDNSAAKGLSWDVPLRGQNRLVSAVLELVPLGSKMFGSYTTHDRVDEDLHSVMGSYGYRVRVPSLRSLKPGTIREVEVLVQKDLEVLVQMIDKRLEHEVLQGVEDEWKHLASSKLSGAITLAMEASLENGLDDFGRFARSRGQAFARTAMISQHRLTGREIVGMWVDELADFDEPRTAPLPPPKPKAPPKPEEQGSW